MIFFSSPSLFSGLLVGSWCVFFPVDLLGPKRVFFAVFSSTGSLAVLVLVCKVSSTILQSFPSASLSVLPLVSKNTAVYYTVK